MATDRNARGITEQELMRIEHDEIIASAEQDRSWWLEPDYRFATPAERDAAITEGWLTKVEPNELFAFCKEVREDESLQYLRHEARALLLRVLKQVNQRVNLSSRGIKLIVNSLHRCDDLQADLAAGPGWYRAAPVGTSSHAAGAAFDLNISSHYMRSEAGDDWIGTWKEAAKDGYAPDVIEELGNVLAELSESGICNVIVEHTISGDEYAPVCYHVCVSPEAFLFLSPEG